MGIEVSKTFEEVLYLACGEISAMLRCKEKLSQLYMNRCGLKELLENVEELEGKKYYSRAEEAV